MAPRLCLRSSSWLAWYVCSHNLDLKQVYHLRPRLTNGPGVQFHTPLAFHHHQTWDTLWAPAHKEIGLRRNERGSIQPAGAVQFWLPDSPRWLLLSGAGKSRAEKDLVRARGSTADAAAVQRELAGIEKSVREAQAMANPGMHLPA